MLQMAGRGSDSPFCGETTVLCKTKVTEELPKGVRGFRENKCGMEQNKSGQ